MQWEDKMNPLIKTYRLHRQSLSPPSPWLLSINIEEEEECHYPHIPGWRGTGGCPGRLHLAQSAGSSIALTGSWDLRGTKAGTARAVLSREVTYFSPSYTIQMLKLVSQRWDRSPYVQYNDMDRPLTRTIGFALLRQKIRRIMKNTTYVSGQGSISTVNFHQIRCLRKS